MKDRSHSWSVTAKNSLFPSINSGNGSIKKEKEPVFSKDVCEDTNANSMFTRLRLRLMFVAFALALLTLFAPHIAIPQAHAQEPTLNEDAITWLQNQQQDNGSFDNNVDSTIDSIFALAANGEDPKDVTQSGNSPLDYLIANAPTYVVTNDNAEAAGKLLLGALVGGIGDSEVFDVNAAIATVAAYYDATTGAYGDGSTADQAWAMLGLSAPGEAIPVNATEYLKELQLDSGGWGATTDASTADIQNTALALQALSAVGVIKTDPVVQQGLEYLSSAQNDDGGWGTQSATTAAATAQALQALASYNEDPQTQNGNTPLNALATLQEDNGSFNNDDIQATSQVLHSLATENNTLLFMPFNFTASTFGGTAPVTVDFDSMHSDAWSTYDWDFGDGTTSDSNDADPSYTYSVPGIYTVTLTMDDTEGTPTTIKRANFISVQSNLEPDFAIEGYSSNTMPMTVTFRNTSEGDYEDVEWDFGDRQQSTDENPSHAYAEPGVYTVTLTISGAGGSATEKKASFVHIHEPLQVNFAANPVCSTPLTMQFNNTSSGASYSDVYGIDPNNPQNLWHFGDGSSSTESSPLHTYDATGTYTVSLTVQDAYGTFVKKTERIEVQPPRSDVSETSHWQSIGQALQWLRSLQSEDGSYADVGYTLDTLLAVAAANQDVASWQSTHSNSMLDYLRGEAADYADDSAARAGKLVLAIAAANLDPHNFGGNDLVDMLNTHYDEATGAYGSNNWDQAFCILGLKAAGEPVPSNAVELLASRATDEGYWTYGPGDESTFSYVDTTALVLQALIAGGQAPDSEVIQNAVAYLHSAQTSDGGFPDWPAWAGQEKPDYGNANSTGLSVQALLAVGEDPLSTRWTISNTNPISFLHSLQQADGGLLWIADSADSNLLATQQAIPAMVGKPFPYASTSVATRKGIEWIASQQQDDGSFAGGWSGNQGTTIDAILAIAAADQNPQDFTSSSGNGALDYLANYAQSYAAQSAAAAGKLLFGVVNAGAMPDSFGDTNLVISVTNSYSPTTGMFGSGSTWDQAWSIVGLVEANNVLSETVPITIPQLAVTYLKGLQADDGGWGFGGSGSVDGTGLALQALAAAGVSKDDPAISAGIDYLWATQNADGGWGYACAFDTSASSTGLAMQGLLAYGEDPRSVKWTVSASDGSPSQATLHTPYDALLALQSQEGGFAGWTGPNDPMASYQSLPAIAQRAFPLQAYAAVQAGFDATPVDGTAPLTVTFTNTSSGDYSESLWDFGDNETSTLFNPTHVYTEPGTYTVKLTMKGPGGEDSFTMDIEVTEGQGTTEPTELAANFTVTPTSGTVPLTVTFTNTSTPDNYTSSLWDFGDGKTSTLTSTEHIYTQAGTYTVTLTVTWPTGTDAISKTSIIQVEQKGTEPNMGDTYVYLPIIMRTTP